MHLHQDNYCAQLRCSHVHTLSGGFVVLSSRIQQHTVIKHFNKPITINWAFVCAWYLPSTCYYKSFNYLQINTRQSKRSNTHWRLVFARNKRLPVRTCLLVCLFSTDVLSSSKWLRNQRVFLYIFQTHNLRQLRWVWTHLCNTLVFSSNAWR